MKKLFLLIFSISLLASLTFAQAGGTAPAPAPSTTDKPADDSGKSGKKHHHHHKHHKKAESTDTSKPQ